MAEADASQWIGPMIEKAKAADTYLGFTFLQLRCASGRPLSDEHRTIVNKMIHDDDELRALFADTTHPPLVSSVGTRQLKALWSSLIDYKPVAQLPSNDKFCLFEYYGLFLAIGLGNSNKSIAHIKQYMDAIPDVADGLRLRFHTAWLSCDMMNAAISNDPTLCHKLSKQIVSQVNSLKETAYSCDSMLCEAWKFAAWSFQRLRDIKNAIKCCKKVLTLATIGNSVASTFAALESAISTLRHFLPRPVFEKIIDKHVTRLLHEGMDENWQEALLLTSYILARGCCSELQCPDFVGMGACKHKTEAYSLTFELRLVKLAKCIEEVQPDMVSIGRDAIWQYHGNHLRRLLNAPNAADYAEAISGHVFECQFWLVHVTCWDWMLDSDRSRTSTVLRDYVAQLHTRDRSKKTQSNYNVEIMPLRNVLLYATGVLMPKQIPDQAVLKRFQKLDKNKAMACRDYELIPLVLGEYVAWADKEGRAQHKAMLVQRDLMTAARSGQ
jgi:hypothetical protein